jgi:cytochrome c biogenesis protein CcdA
VLRLFTFLTPISLADSLSLVPLCIVPLAVLLAGRRPLFGSVSFLAGIVVPYYLFGVLLLLGIDPVFDRIHAALSKDPDTLDLIVQIAIGIVLVIFGYRVATARRTRAAKKLSTDEMGPLQAFGIGFGFTLAGAWGAFPYFAAVDQILKADLTALPSLLALLWYNLVFVAPLAGLVVIGKLAGRRAEAILDAVRRFTEKLWPRVVVAVLVLLGVVLVADAIGWFFDRPLIPYP